MSTRTWVVMSPREVSDATGIPYESVLDHLATGEMEGAKHGGRWYVREDAIDKFLAPTNTDNSRIRETA